MQTAHFNANFLRRAIIRLALMRINNVVVRMILCQTQTDQYNWSLGRYNPIQLQLRQSINPSYVVVRAVVLTLSLKNVCLCSLLVRDLITNFS